MSLQLIVYPQEFNGLNPMSGAGTQVLVDGINFTTVNTSSSTLNVSGGQFIVPQNYIDSFGSFNVNTWYRFSGSANATTESNNVLVFANESGIVQRLSNLLPGVTYNVFVEIGALNAGGFFVKHFSGTTEIASSFFSAGSFTNSTQTVPIVVNSSTDTIVFYSLASTFINSLSVVQTSTGVVVSNLSNGQEILDLYEDEDIPLTLSVDEFKNAAEQVKSYSKAFMLPGTKRNNQIFDNLFEITRSDNGSIPIFNPYVKTQCTLKQDGFVLFEGYLRLIDIQDKEGEVSYNINIYSEVIALADLLGERTFEQLGFTELEHTYNKTNIKDSWTGSVTYLNSATSNFRSADTLKYPFCDWSRQWVIGNNPNGNPGPNHNMPELVRFEQAFRPFIQIKYLIDRIFDQSDFPFSYTSTFFNTTDFKKLYMDFNWGGNEIPNPENEYTARYTGTNNVGTGSFIPFQLNASSLPPSSTLPPNYNTSTYIITATSDGETYLISYKFRLKNTSSSGVFLTANCRWVKNKGLPSEVPFNQMPFIMSGGGAQTYQGFLSVILDAGDTLEAQFDSSASIRQDETFTYSSKVTFIVSSITVTSATLTTLRGELEQWQFLKGIMTMFNLVTVPDKSDPNNILIEPYNDMFLENADSSDLNWTEKVDVEEIKLTPLTDLNKNTIFKFVEDDDDFAFKNYKTQVQNHLYGSQMFDAQTSANGLETILSGEKEIIADPFAATVPKPLDTQYNDFIVPAIYSYNPDDGTSESFDNSPRIMFNNGVVDLSATNITYYIPAQNGTASENAENFLQFSHLTDIPTVVSNPPVATDTRDFHFGICQLIQPIGDATPNNLFNTYWLPYYNDLYNPDTRTMTLKVNLGAGDINTFKFYDVVMIKNRKFRVNKIDYKPNDLSTVEFILIP